jgi:Reverse transcriptase (RNA-dependent DNA polymerase)
LQRIANEFPDAFTDTKRVTKSHIPVLNAPTRIEITPAEVTIQRKRGRPIGFKDKKPRKMKERNNAVGVTLAKVTNKISEEIVSKISEEIGSRTPEEVVDKVPEETQAPNDYEISINYVQNDIIWNRNETRVDEIFTYAIAIEVINEENYVSKTPEECMHRNDWPKWKDALKTELDSLEKRNVFGPVILTPKNVNPVGYKWVFAIKRNEKNEIVRYKARLVAQGFTQIRGVDYEETYSPVVDAITLRFLISLAITENLQMCLMDVVTVTPRLIRHDRTPPRIHNHMYS